jgi:hypothetical protein
MTGVCHEPDVRRNCLHGREVLIEKLQIQESLFFHPAVGCTDNKSYDTAVKPYGALC